jgi:alkylation response protein AidB-like acyl-CoA dehydrogenase
MLGGRLNARSSSCTFGPAFLGAIRERSNSSISHLTVLSTKTDRPSRDELVRRAQALVPALRTRAEDAERARRCPPETIADYDAQHLLRICQPARYGGYELGWDILCEISQTLARGCGSQAWVQNIFSDHAQKVATFPLDAQEEVWGDEPAARIAASFDPVGTARSVPGGVVYSGRHAFSSGVDYADWLICGGHVYDGDAKQKRCFFLLRRADVTIIDDWHVVGFAGTGSKSFEARDVFIPAYRILDGSDADEGTGPGSRVHAAPVFRLPRGGITSTGFAAVAVGIAEGFLDEYLRYTKPRKSRGTPVAELMGTQIGIGSASAEIEGAGLVYLAAARDAMQTLARGERITKGQKLRAKRDSAFAAQLCLNAVTRLFNAAGGRALFTNNAMQRHYRDLVAAASHHSIVWDSVTAEYGRFALES